MIRIREPDKISSEYIKKIGVLHKKGKGSFCTLGIHVFFDLL